MPDNKFDAKARVAFGFRSVEERGGFFRPQGHADLKNREFRVLTFWRFFFFFFFCGFRALELSPIADGAAEGSSGFRVSGVWVYCLLKNPIRIKHNHPDNSYP